MRTKIRAFTLIELLLLIASIAILAARAAAFDPAAFLVLALGLGGVAYGHAPALAHNRRRRTAPLIALLALGAIVSCTSARAAITNGFTTGSGSASNQWTLNAAICCGGIPAINVSSNTLNLQRTGAYGGGTAFYNTPQPLGVNSNGFTARFYVQLQVGTDLFEPGAMAFVLHNDTRGRTARGCANLGFNYGSVGYCTGSSAISNSVAFYIDFSTARFGFLENPPGAVFSNIPARAITGGYLPDIYLDLTRTQSADPILVTINYNGAKTLTATLVNLVHTNTAAITYTLSSANLAAATGSTNGTAYVGFSGGDNGRQYITDVSQFTFTAGYTAPPNVPPANLTPPPPYIPYSGPPKTWRIQPMGDSITRGINELEGANGGYRNVLNALLTNCAAPHQFVGNLQGDSAEFIATGQAWHDGVSGARVVDLLNNVYRGDGTGWIETKKPDIVLLQIGINDFGSDLGLVTGQLDQLVSNMFVWAEANNPAFRLLIARISPHVTLYGWVTNYNNYIVSTLVPKYLGLGKQITLVDQFSQFLRVDRNGNPKDDTWIDPNLFATSPHLNQAGYNRMAYAWYNALMPVLNSSLAWQQTWLATNGLPVNATGQGAWTASPPGDGIPNLMKFALWLNAWTNGYQGRLTIGQTNVSNETYLSLTYTRPEPPPTGISYNVEIANDLVAQDWSETNTVEIANTLSNQWRTITRRDVAPFAANPQRFIRLRITQ